MLFDPKEDSVICRLVRGYTTYYDSLRVMLWESTVESSHVIKCSAYTKKDCLQFQERCKVEKSRHLNMQDQML